MAHLVTGAAVPRSSSAAPEDDRVRIGRYRMVLENDNFGIDRSDRFYTSGGRFSVDFPARNGQTWLLRGLDRFLLRWVDLEPPPRTSLSQAAKTHSRGWAIGQNIYTPANIESAVVDSLDRPYAGWLYVGIFHDASRGVGRFNARHGQELQLGVTGPPSLARESQTIVHEVLGGPRPKGWDNQLGFEPGITYRYRLDVALLPVRPLWRHSPIRREGVVHSGFQVGSILNAGEAGVRLRIGYGIVQTWPDRIDVPAAVQAGADSTIQPKESDRPTPAPDRGSESKWRFHVFGGIDGRLIAYNRFLQGDHLTPRPFVSDSFAGAVLGFNQVELAWTHVWRSREIDEQKYPHKFGSLSVTVHP